MTCTTFLGRVVCLTVTERVGQQPRKSYVIAVDEAPPPPRAGWDKAEMSSSTGFSGEPQEEIWNQLFLSLHPLSKLKKPCSGASRDSRTSRLHSIFAFSVCCPGWCIPRGTCQPSQHLPIPQPAFLKGYLVYDGCCLRSRTWRSPCSGPLACRQFVPAGQKGRERDRE